MTKKIEIRNSTAEFLIFMSEGKEEGVEVMYADETIWCTQDAIATLFDKGRTTVTEHLANIFNEGELDKDSVCRKFRRTASDGKPSYRIGCSRQTLTSCNRTEQSPCFRRIGNESAATDDRFGKRLRLRTGRNFMVGPYKVITLCGSTRFKEQFLEAGNDSATVNARNLTEERLTITRAICRQTDGSRTDGKKMFQLPFPVMGFDVNLPAINHPKVTSDENRFMRLFLTDYCKALSRAFNCKVYFHKEKLLESESKGRLKEYSIRFASKNRVSISFENKYPVVQKHESLPPLDSKLPYGCKIKDKFLFCK